MISNDVHEKHFQRHSSAKEYDGACYKTFGEEASMWCCRKAFQRFDLMAILLP